MMKWLGACSHASKPFFVEFYKAKTEKMLYNVKDMKIRKKK